MTRCSVTLVGLFASAAFGAAPELCNTPLFQDGDCCFQFATDVTCSGMAYPYIAGEWYLDDYGIANYGAGTDANTCLVQRQQLLSGWCGVQATMGFATTGGDPEGDCGLYDACDDLDPGMTLCIGCTATSCDPTDRVTQPWGSNTDPVFPSMGCPADYAYVCTKPDPSGYDPGAGASTAWTDSVEKCDTNGDCVCLVHSNFDNSAGVPLVATPQGIKNVLTVAADQAAVGKWAGWAITNYYNDVQCGWGPRDMGNSVPPFDEHPNKCPGNLNALPGSCSETGRLWSLSDVYGAWSCPTNGEDPVTSFQGVETRYYLSTRHFTPVLEQGPFVVTQLAGPANPPPALQAHKGAWVMAMEVDVAGVDKVVIETVDPATLLTPPNATAPPATTTNALTTMRISFVGKQLTAGHHTLSIADATVTVSAKRAQSTRRIGSGWVEQVTVKTDGLELRITSAKANKFADEQLQVLGLHLDVEFLSFDESAVRGALPEMWGLQPMTEKTKLLLDQKNMDN